MSNRDFSGLSKDEVIELLLKENNQLNNKVQTLTEDVKILRMYLFAKKNEKVTKEDKLKAVQFDELEDSLSEEKSDLPDKDKKTPKTPGRKPLPEDMPRKKLLSMLRIRIKTAPVAIKKGH